MKTKSPLNRTMQLALGAAILASLVVAVFSYRAIVASSGTTDGCDTHTRFFKKLQNLFAATQSIESSYRGFALTGKESYLELYHASTVNTEQGEATVRNLTVDNPKQQILVPTLEGPVMARSLKLRVVAEGVETRKELEFLQAHQCDEAQGYYFSRPVLPEQFAKLLETGISETLHR
jgi:CHASE3 domain sensor protein